MERLPPFVLAERDALIVEVYEAFAGVSREGGVSWSETDEIDNYRPPEERQAERQAAARAKDFDTAWTDVVDDPEWQGDTGIGGWTFLDPIGYRYYLPVQMIRCLRRGGDLGNFGIAPSLTYDPNDSIWKLDQWSAIDTRQRLCVKRFIEYMYVAASVEYGSPTQSENLDDLVFVCSDADQWDEAYTSYWENLPDEPTEPRR